MFLAEKKSSGYKEDGECQVIIIIVTQRSDLIGCFALAVNKKRYPNAIHKVNSCCNHNCKENDNTLKFAKHISTETSVIFSW